MTPKASDITASVSRARIYTFAKRNVMAWPADLCKRYGIDESVEFEIIPENVGFRLVINRKDWSLPQ